MSKLIAKEVNEGSDSAQKYFDSFEFDFDELLLNYGLVKVSPQYRRAVEVFKKETMSILKAAYKD
jgi:hypothetical protein